MGSSFGKLFRVTTWGESHGPAVGVVVDGCPAGIELNEEHLQIELNRRRPGQSHITTQRKEQDLAKILSGVFEGKTTGTPIHVHIDNQDSRSKDYEEMKTKFRPSHADYSYEVKYGIRDWRGGGRSSARETVGRVAAGAIASRLLKNNSNATQVISYVKQIKNIVAVIDSEKLSRKVIESHITRCPDINTAERMVKEIEQARKKGDSLGGIASTLYKALKNLKLDTMPLIEKVTFLPAILRQSPLFKAPEILDELFENTKDENIFQKWQALGAFLKNFDYERLRSTLGDSKGFPDSTLGDLLKDLEGWEAKSTAFLHDNRDHQTKEMCQVVGEIMEEACRNGISSKRVNGRNILSLMCEQYFQRVNPGARMLKNLEKKFMQGSVDVNGVSRSNLNLNGKTSDDVVQSAIETFREISHIETIRETIFVVRTHAERKWKNGRWDTKSVTFKGSFLWQEFFFGRDLRLVFLFLGVPKWIRMHPGFLEFLVSKQICLEEIHDRREILF